MRLAAVGDVTAFHREPESGYEFAGPVLADFDVVFAQNERLYSRTTAIPDVGFTELTDPDHVASLKLGHFDVISFASNHCYDLGPDVFMDTLETLRKQGFAVIGAGRDIAQARQPAVFECDGARIGFLGYCSVLRPNYEAGPDKPGAVPMRAHTLYQQIDYQPGTDPKILTFADRDNLRALIEDIKAAKARTDFLAVSVHWGIHLVKGVIADYEAEVAHAAIDAGADAILGHGPHLLKAIEIYRGKPIFYSLGNFCCDSPMSLLAAGMARNAEFRHLIESHRSITQATDYDEWFFAYSLSPDQALSMIAEVDFSADRDPVASFRPVVINNRAQPQPMTASEPGFTQVLDYVREVTASQGLGTRFDTDGDRVIVSGA
jgi:Bacterial capsule synthesis protein PGA_cap